MIRAIEVTLQESNIYGKKIIITVCHVFATDTTDRNHCIVSNSYTAQNTRRRRHPD